MNSDINPRPRKRIRPVRRDPSPDQAEGAEPKAKVGYGNPPKEHQWKKGVSGNPKGKAPGTKSFSTLVDKALDVKLEVVERGKARKYTKREIGATRFANAVVEGDMKTLALLMKHESSKVRVAAEPEAISEAPLSEGETSILDHFMAAARLAAARELGIELSNDGTEPNNDGAAAA